MVDDNPDQVISILPTSDSIDGRFIKLKSINKFVWSMFFMLVCTMYNLKREWTFHSIIEDNF